jgi:hypothetical protein
MRKTLITMGLLFAAPSCVLDTGDTGDGVETADTQQAITGWAVGFHGTTTDMVGADTGWSSSTSTCVLTAVTGDLGEGGYYEINDVASVAEVTGGSNGHYFIIAHGGAYTNQVNARVWANNPVGAGVVCVPYPNSATGVWKTQPAKYGVAPPKKITGLAANRRCFLSGIIGGEQNFTHYADSMVVKQITTTDPSHPTTGWYVEGTVASNPYTEAPSYANATCIDFPQISGEWGGAFGGATNTMTTGTGKKMCGLTGLFGAYNVNSYSNGTMLNAPAAQTGNWTMTVSASKFSQANCIE